MLSPKRVRYRRHHRGHYRGNSKRGNTLAFGTFGLKALETEFVPARTIEAARVALTRFMKREGKVWIRIFPDKPITRKPAEVRMGKGKGAPDHWIAVVKPGRIIFEAEGVSLEVAEQAMALAAQKLNLKTKFVVRRDFEQE